jgi:hypothetical protein
MSKMMVKEWIFDGTEDKKKLAARLITAATVLLLIFAGSPFANINTNTASAVTNPYAPVGTIVVNTNNTAATFTLTGPATYTGSGTGWSQADAPAGTYTITYDPIPGYDTPASEIQNLVSGDSIAFTGLYDKTVYTLTLQASDLTLQASTDTYVSQFKQENDINYGTDIIMKVRSFLPGNSGNVKNERSFIMFDIPPLPSGSTIVSATLQLYTANVSNATRNYTLMPVEQQWNETNVTWNNQPSVISSATSYADTPLSPGWVNWSVTSGVMAWANGATNYGWQISDMNENSPIDYSTAFYTRDYSDTSLRPTLVIQYTIV